MKKNRMLRMASALMVLTLLTTCIIGGTFAKYTTSDSASDTARVAKFGVVATVSGDLFGSTYKAVGDGNTITTYAANGGTVSAKDKTDKVVAPGTKDDKGLTLSVAGTPEVSTKVTLGNAKNGNADYANSDIYLAVGDYGVMVEYTGERTAENIVNYYTLTGTTYTKATAVPADANTKVYELRDAANVADNSYYPLKWTVTPTSGTATEATTVAAVVTELKKKLFGDGNENKTFAPNEANTLSATVTWEWPFEDGGTDVEKAARNAKDTILGDMIAAKLTETNPIAVVKKDDGAETYSSVQYKDITSGASTIAVAYTGDTEPSAVTDTSVCACLTVAFNASLTVEQID